MTVESTWENRDLVVLDLAVQYFDDPSVHRLGIPVIVERTGLSEDDVKRALRALASASPRLIKGSSADQVAFPLFLTGVTGPARQLVGAWPSPDSLTDRLVAALEAAASAEPNEEKRSALRHAAAVLGGMGRDIFVEVASKALGHVTGLG
jgi:hypothetical protein